MLPDYYDRHEAAKALGLNVQTLDHWRQDHKGPPVTRLGNRVLYNKESLIAWVREQERQP